MLIVSALALPASAEPKRVQPLYKEDTHVQITYEAFWLLPPGPMRDEVLQNLGGTTGHGCSSSPETGTKLTEGAYEEDCDFHFTKHFWDPDTNGGLWGNESALTRANALYELAVGLYESGKVAEAYYELGRVAHLLEDMAQPAHVHLDAHPPGANDNYEEICLDYAYRWSAAAPPRANDTMNRYVGYDSNGRLQPLDYTILPSKVKEAGFAASSWLERLFLNLAETADAFESEDQPADTDGIQRGHPRTIISWHTETTPPGAFTESEALLHADTLVPLAIRYVAALYQLFWDETHPPAAPKTLSAVAVSSSQINLTWSDTANETGFKIERRLGPAGSWSQISPRSANVSSVSDTGLAAGTAYFYRVRAYNAAGDSPYTAIASATTQSPAGTTRKLTIASSNPSSGVSVSSFVGNGSFASGTTPTSRSFASGTPVGITCPSTLPGGLVFQKWQLDGNDFSYSTNTTVTMNSAHTLTAVFGAAQPPSRVLSSLTIEGPSGLDERTSGQYLARAYYNDGSSAYVNAQWDDDSTYGSISTAGMLDSSAVTSDQNIQVIATFTASGVTKTATKGVIIYNTDSVPTYSLTLAASHGHINVQPQMSAYPTGTEVRLVASPDDDYIFDHWSGDASGVDRTVYVTMNRNRSITAHFAADTSYGRLQVTLLPQQAANEGAQWKYDLFTNWRDSGNVQDGISPRVNRYIHFKDIPGWITPDEIRASIAGGQTTVTSATYREIPGAVQVTLSPNQVSAAGARWQLDSGSWQSSGASVSGVPPGIHQIEFLAVPGWTTPARQQITVQRGGTSIALGTYQPPAGTPLITAVSPKVGPIAGGTLLTIEGANFSPNSTVLVGGRSASNVTFAGTTRLTAVTPPSPTFGSAEIVVTSGATSASNANAFAYGIPRGTNMTLISSSGGTYQAVACNNQFLFIGQGTTFLVYDIANPNNPTFISSVTVPGLIRAIALNGNYAVVGANDAGVHIVDTSDPSAPRLRGFYDTSGSAYGVKVLAGRAYVADGSGGLLILDLTNPDGPTLLSSLDLGAFAFDIALKNSVSGLFAIVSARGRMFIVDVSDPQSPSKLSEVVVSGDNWSVALAGNLAFLGRLANGVDTVDISNLGNPVSRGRILTNYVYVTVAATGNTVVLAGGGQRAFNLVDVSDLNTTERGHLDVSEFSLSYGAYRMAIQNGIVWVAGGPAVWGVNISNVDAPQRIFRKDDQGGRLEKVAKVGSNVVSASVESVFAFGFSGSSLTPTASLPSQRSSNPWAFFFYGDTLFDVGGLFGRFQLQPNGSLAPLESFTIPNVHPDDAYLNSSRLLSVGQTYPGDGHGVVTEHDPSANWILRQKHLPFIVGGGGVQIAGAQEFFVLGYFDSSSGKWNLASYNWSASTPSWQISGLESIQSLQLSHNNRFMHVGEQFKYRIYDVLDPANPVSLSTNTTSNSISDILINGDEASLAARGQGVLVYDIGDKSQPRLMRNYDTPGNAFAVAQIGNRLMVADYDAGIQVLGFPDIVPPQVFITAPVALPQFQTTNSAITLGGGAEDDSGQVNRVIWSNDRGGGGAAEGTTDWAVSVVNLQAGTNVLTVTAFDAEGNSATDQITTTFTPSDTTAPVISITDPKPDDEFVVGTSEISLSGAAVDNQSVTDLTWSNDRGGSGAMSLAGQNWTVTSLLLEPGPNVVQVTATDSSGNIATDTAVIFFEPPDTTAPSVNIEFPTLNALYETEFSTLNLSGMATDNRSVTEVKWTSNHGGSGVANGVSPWSVNDIPLQPGLNVIEVTAYDAAGNIATDSLYVFVPAPAVYSVSPHSGPASGTQVVTIGGSNLTNPTAVTFGGAAGTVTGSSSNSITVTSPAHAAGAVDVVVTTANGSATYTSGYTYVAAPAISTVSPNRGSTARGQKVTITGTNLADATLVTIGGTTSTITNNSATSVDVMTPAHASGTVNVVVTTAYGSVTSSGAYTYGASTLGTPTAFVASASSASQVDLTWGLVSGATAYEIFRSSLNGPYNLVNTTAAGIYKDSGLSANTTYFYRVRAIASSGSASALTVIDPAITLMFTDSILAGFLAKTAHLTELRTAVNAVRAAAGLSSATFTNNSPAGVRVEAVHILELRTALAEARTAIGLSALYYTDPTIAPRVTPIKAAHLMELRAGVQ